MRKILGSFTLLSALAWSGDGRTPRSSSNDYPVHQDMTTAAIAAVRVSSEQLNKIFPAELSKKYVVVEVAIYPKDGPAIDISTMDFVLKLGPDGESRPETAEEIAAIWRPHTAHPDVANKPRVNSEAGVIVGHGTDPVTGRPVTRAGTYERVGVASGDDPNRPLPPISNSRVDSDRMEAMLNNWALQDGKTSSPVAGYLYFPLRARKTKGTLELQYSHDPSAANLTLPGPSK